jgi:hypothetical protein
MCYKGSFSRFLFLLFFLMLEKLIRQGFIMSVQDLVELPIFFHKIVHVLCGKELLAILLFHLQLIVRHSNELDGFLYSCAHSVMEIFTERQIVHLMINSSKNIISLKLIIFTFD